MKKYLFIMVSLLACNVYSMELDEQANQSELQTSDHEIVNAMSYCIEHLLQDANPEDRAEIEKLATMWKSFQPKMDVWLTKNPLIEQQILNEQDVKEMYTMLKLTIAIEAEQQKKNTVKKELSFESIPKVD